MRFQLILAKCSERSGAKDVPNVPNVPHVPNVPNTNIVPVQDRVRAALLEAGGQQSSVTFFNFQNGLDMPAHGRLT